MGKQKIFGALTPRQIEALRHVSDGLCDKEIAKAMGCAPDTVRSHLHFAYAALGAKTRTEAVVKAMRQGLISINAPAPVVALREAA